MKFELGQLVFYMFNNKIASGIIIGRRLVEIVDSIPYTTEACQQQKDRFGPSGEAYLVSQHIGALGAEKLFTSREELINSL